MASSAASLGNAFWIEEIPLRSASRVSSGCDLCKQCALIRRAHELGVLAVQRRPQRQAGLVERDPR